MRAKLNHLKRESTGPMKRRRLLPRTSRANDAGVIGLMLWMVAGLGSIRTTGEQVAVRHAEGIVHGLLVLRSLDGNALADGDLIQNARGNRVTARLVFLFKDGSLHDETAVFSQRQQFRLVNDHLVQRGPSFPRPLDLSINATSGD